MKNKVLSLLGLSKRAGYLSEGFDQVAEQANKGKSNLVVVTKDISQNTLKKVKKLTEETNTRFLQLEITKEEMQNAMNSFAAVLSVSDKGMSNEICKQAGNQVNGG